MADHVAVGEVGEDEVIPLVHRRLYLFRHLRQTQLRLLIKGNPLGRGYAHIGLSLEGLVVAAVEEEGHMGELLGLGTVELPQPRLAQHLGQRLFHLFRGESDGKILEFVMIHGHDAEFQILQGRTVKVPEVRVGKGLGQLDLPFTPAAAEDHLIPAADLAHGGAVLFRQHHGLQIIVGLPLGVSGFHRSGEGFAADKTILRHGMLLLISAAGTDPAAERND